jgi:hypothetical protein
VHRGGAKRIGGLQRVSALDASLTPRAVSDDHMERPDDGALDRQFFLILSGDSYAADDALTVRTLRGKRRDVGFIDVPRNGAVRAAPIGGARLPTRSAGMRRRRPARERRGLPIDGAPRRIELLLQALVFAAQLVALGLRTAQVVAQAVVFTPQFLEDLLRVARRRIRRMLSDLPLIADRSAGEKYKELMATI